MTMGPYPEVPHALYRQREQYRLAIFINSRDDLIASTVAAIGASFGYVITAEQAGAYKPSREMFQYAYRQMDATPDEAVHVTMGKYWYMKARYEPGLRGIWVNRQGEEGNPDWLPYAELSKGPPACFVRNARGWVADYFARPRQNAADTVFGETGTSSSYKLNLPVAFISVIHSSIIQGL
ncbi:HAD hydrolase-like protein (plasmid) [Agrobacterium fabrum]|jgi:hypothetical protein|uniref:Haloacid dehalogenase n=1 Tax=Agrobacterium fabrum (strain C58 / ATCC 33970) TaxID=176299 RepID=Q8UK04_AGRFC|nr:HAD hydrolase-like protein [Agrobacterium fabrum]KJX90150.1 haloacid dehalogenase, type II [Agrobacterium tumefaciens]AAL46008.1 haloacid dehalogenase [Agrobacterium fabrum str. C58]MCX2878421.1 HAD hydrolase-like protein [Agrobacterium fabrum]TRB21126.1 haloacid dehalogenase [Agrobacterium fabrum]WEN04021.1 HAD hydrolase-like protein [Agrobacterium fabrum]